MNWTDDFFAIQENVLATIDSPELAATFLLDFEQLWSTGAVERTGFVEPRPLRVGGRKVRGRFTPGFGEQLSPGSRSGSAARTACASARP
jgi:hypothetical protein